MLSLVCAAQNYDWGRKGTGEVAALHRANSGRDIDSGAPYAELWVGTHPNGPSVIRVENGPTLAEYVEKNPESLGPAVLSRFGPTLPFLLKVLSVHKALSIQAHPDLDLAKKLHAEQPQNYKDPNHKPEMAIALGAPFEALCSFVTTPELRERLQAVSELRKASGEEEAAAFLAATEGEFTKEQEKAALRKIFTSLMTQEPSVVASALTELVARLNTEGQTRELTALEQLVLRLDSQYPGGDVGVFAAYVLNHFTLQPGEGVFLAANEPHAYLSGECVEIMATSDNVVRAGLTPKFRDTDTLCSMLTYEQGKPEILKGNPVDAHTRRYQPPVDEFELDIVDVPEGGEYTLQPCGGPSLVFVYAGEGHASIRASEDAAPEQAEVKRGEVLFIPAHSEVKLSAATSIQVFRAGCSSRIL